MRFEGDVEIRAPRQQVWAFLTDPRAVGSCAPDVESLEVLDDGRRFRAVAAVGFGAMKARFVTDAEWLDLEAPNRARMKAHGKAPGSAVDVQSEMSLSDGEGAGTHLHWVADVNVVGTIASIAARLMGGVAQRLTDAFFEAVRVRIEGEAKESAGLPFGSLALEQAEGAILAHNIAAADGRRLLRKGRVLAVADIEVLRSLGRRSVYASRPGAADVGENEAAQRIAASLGGPNLEATSPHVGRVNLLATAPGLLRLDPGRLTELNLVEGVSVSTLTSGSVVKARQLAATVKIVPFFVPGTSVERAVAIAATSEPLLRIEALPPHRVALILVGSPSAHDRIVSDFDPPLRARLTSWGASLDAVLFVSLEDETGEAALAAALRAQQAAGITMILIAGETAIVDRHDVAPRAIEAAGGTIEAYGAPVDPGNLLLVAYLDGIPVVGAPGCARSAKANVVDLVVPRLLAGERLDRAAIAALGHGGLLEEVPERPVPRETN